MQKNSLKLKMNIMVYIVILTLVFGFIYTLFSFKTLNQNMPFFTLLTNELKQVILPLLFIVILGTNILIKRAIIDYSNKGIMDGAILFLISHAISILFLINEASSESLRVEDIGFLIIVIIGETFYQLPIKMILGSVFGYISYKLIRIVHKR